MRVSTEEATQASGAGPEITFQPEPISAIWQEAIPLMRSNHAEVGGLPHELFAPQLERFEQVEALGLLHTYTMRVSGTLAGYGLFILAPHMNYPSEVTATSHVVYVQPEHRGRRSMRFLLWMKAQLRGLGAKWWGLQCPVTNDWSRTLGHLGLRPVETFYIGGLS